ncbi:hypothetical protein [Amycolatopsis sp. WQ 127309]|uniref:hypothetical protein n=1 Tax=Amycolatopsis sp. WQ 127309 TaxID=2932773 RepID=UPI001FF4C6B3|nr:hypothetical protein [Amycolatopsis sp. WQ 127309]UOZ03505.1 hypothetical protein MUY22_32205 [Amycolatopsis sp. WQ 127309]
MTALADRLAMTASNGDVMSWAELDELSVAEHAGEVAASSLAPILAEALVASADRRPDGWDLASAGFVAGLVNQTSLLALVSSVEALLASPATLQTQGKRLHDALLEGLSSAIRTNPLLAAGRLEGAVRLAVANAVNPFAVVGILTSISDDIPEEYAERLPRLLGAAMDRWADNSAFVETIREALDQLRHHETAAADAMFELGCDQLRTALAAETLPSAMKSLTTALGSFTTADAADEARHDARAYAAACDAILAFSAQDAARMADARRRITEALQQRDAWLSAMHLPSWLRPRLAAELAWHRLVLVLESAGDYLSQPVWFNVWEALDAVLQAYRQARTMRPLPSSANSAGLAAIIEPAIGGAILQRQSHLAGLSRSIVEAAKPGSPMFDVTTAEKLLACIEGLGVISRDREPRSPSSDIADGDRGDDEPHRPDTSRLYELAPALTRALGEQQAAVLAEDLDDDKLRTVEGLVHSGELSRSRTAHPVLDPLLDKVLLDLGQSSAFTGRVRTTFSLLVEQTILFLFSRADLTTKTWGLHKEKDKDYRRLLQKGSKKPLEGDLQQDYYQWLATGQLAGQCAVEISDIARGRADVVITFGTIRYLTEIKRELKRADPVSVEAAYLQQATEYGNTNVPFGQLLVLDLTPHLDGTPRLDESVWVARHKPQGTVTDRWVVAGVVAGNRPTPSGLSV